MVRAKAVTAIGPNHIR